MDRSLALELEVTKTRKQQEQKVCQPVVFVYKTTGAQRNIGALVTWAFF
jgi:hypothetical protein